MCTLGSPIPSTTLARAMGSGLMVGVWPRQLYVVNSHIHWDPRFADVKLVQAQILLEEMERITNRDPVIFCADLNSTTDSAVYEVPPALP